MPYTKHLDVRDSTFSVIRGINPNTDEAIVGLLNVLGAIIAEHSKIDPTERQRLIEIVNRKLPEYVDAYTRGDNPLRT